MDGSVAGRFSANWKLMGGGLRPTIPVDTPPRVARLIAACWAGDGSISLR
jgi:hypothetical protein